MVSVTAKTVENWFNNHRRVQAYALDGEGGGVGEGAHFWDRTAGGGGGDSVGGGEEAMGEWIEDVSDWSDESEWEEVLFREENEVRQV